MMIRHTSASVYWQQDVSDGGAMLITSGGGNRAESFRMSSIFLAKKAVLWE